MKVRTRIAPSPTGMPHIGTIYQALFNYAWAKQSGGEFLLRIEDTDQKRLVPGAEKAIKMALDWFGLKPDEIHRQSERLQLYQDYANRLVLNKKAYNKDGALWVDIGKESFVILKSDGYPTYHLASVVDDHDMKITHVIRGEEWLPSLPKHILLYNLFGWNPPEFFHTPLLRNPDKSKMSKRTGNTDVTWYQTAGYLPESILNYLGHLGWTHPEGKETFDLDEFIVTFKPEDIRKASPIFDLKKLQWLNGEYIRNMPLVRYNQQQFLYQSRYSDPLDDLSPMIWDGCCDLAQSRIQTLAEFESLVCWLVDPPVPSNKKLAESLKDNLEENSWNSETILIRLKTVMEVQGVKMKDLYRIFTGNDRGLPLPQMLEMLGREEVLRRL